MTFIAAPRHDRMDAPFVLDGPVNGEWFTAYVRKVLVPTLGPGDIVIMDDLGSHKGKPVRRAQNAPAKSRGKNDRGEMETDQPPARSRHPGRTRKLPRQRRIRVNLNASRLERVQS